MPHSLHDLDAVHDAPPSDDEALAGTLVLQNVTPEDAHPVPTHLAGFLSSKPSYPSQDVTWFPERAERLLDRCFVLRCGSGRHGPSSSQVVGVEGLFNARRNASCLPA